MNDPNPTRAELQEKVALVTGGGGGIGRATSLLLAREGAAVAVVDLGESAAVATVAEIHRAGGQAISLAADVSSEPAAQAAVERTCVEFGALHILFNNAGIIRRTSILDTTVEEWDLVVAINLRGVFLMSRFAIPRMIDSGGGHDREYRLGLGVGGRWRRGVVLRDQSRGREPDQGDGHRPRPTEDPRQLRLPRRHGHRHAGRRGSPTWDRSRSVPA